MRTTMAQSRNSIRAGLLVLLGTMFTAVLPAGAAESSALSAIPGDAIVAASGGTQNAPALARGATSTLVVWSDWRASLRGSEYETSRDVYGLRLDTAGNPIESVPFAIAAGPGAQENPKVAWNGTSWLVVFESTGVSGTGFYYEKSLQAVRVSAAGAVLDTEPIAIPGVTPIPYAWALASDGDQWVIAIQGTSTSGDVVGMRVSAAGVLLDPPVRRLVAATYYMRSNFKLAYAGGVFLLTFDDAYVNGVNDTKAVRFDSSLNLLDGAPLALLDRPLADLASSGNGLYAVWNQQKPDFSMAVTGSRISTSGQRLDGAGVDLSGANAAQGSTPIVVEWEGSQWKAGWPVASGARFARVTSGGQVLDPGGVFVAGATTGPTAASGDGGIEIASTVYDGSTDDVVASKLNAGSAWGTQRILSVATPQQTSADLATSGAGAMLVFRSTSSAQARVLAMRLDGAGNPLLGEPIEVASGPSVNGPGEPAVAWNGTHFLVAWGSGSAVVAQRLLPSGAKVGAPVTVLAQSFGRPAVAALGEVFLVVGRKYGSTPQIIVAVAARVRGSDGALLDISPIVLPGSGYVSQPPAVTTLDGRWLVAFHSNWSHDESNASTVVDFVAADGTLGASTGAELFSTAGGNGIFEIGLASNGSVALLVQSKEITSGVETDLLAHVIAADGTIGPLVNLTPWVGNQYRPRVAWDGTHFVVVYQDQKNRLTEIAVDQIDARGDLFGMRVTAAGTVVDPQGFVISAVDTAETDPVVASIAGRNLFAASLLLADASHASYRVVTEQRSSAGNVWPVAVATATPASGDVPLTVSLSSAGTTDPGGAIVSRLWDFGDGSTSTQANPTHTFTAAKPYLVTLTVTDGGGASATQAIRVNALAPNQSPVAVARATPANGPAPLDVVFDAASSYDPDGAIGNMLWTYHDGSETFGPNGYYTYTQNGTYSVTLTVYDGRGATGTDTVTVTVGGAANQAPTAVAQATPSAGSAPLAVTFSGASSSDPDGSIVGYRWDFGDGGISNGVGVSHTYTAAGNYTVTLTVTDDRGATDTDTVLVRVRSSGCQPARIDGGARTYDVAAFAIPFAALAGARRRSRRSRR